MALELPSTTAPDAARDRTRRVLYFAPKTFWPPDTGAKLRNFHLARVLARSARLTYLGFAEPGEEPASDPPADLMGRTVTVGRGAGYSLPNIIRGFVGRTPLPLLNYTTEPMRQALGSVLAAES